MASKVLVAFFVEFKTAAQKRETKTRKPIFLARRQRDTLAKNVSSEGVNEDSFRAHSDNSSSIMADCTGKRRKTDGGRFYKGSIKTNTICVATPNGLQTVAGQASV